MNEPTEAEKRWWRKFRALLRTMPKTMSIEVGPWGECDAVPRGADAVEFAKHGHTDNLEGYGLPSIKHHGAIINNASRL